MAHNRANDDSEPPWRWNPAWVEQSRVNEAQEPYAAPLTAGVDTYTQTWGDQSLSRIDSNLTSSYTEGGYEEPVTTEFNPPSHSGGWQSPQTIPESQTSPATYRMPQTQHYDYTSRDLYPVDPYNPTLMGHPNALSYTTRSAPAGAQEEYDPSVRGMPTSPDVPTSTDVQYTPAANPQGDENYSVPCPYRCGAVLSGTYALGNLTRHLKSRACSGSGQAKIRYPCPIEGCDKEYARSDGLKVHMRRYHDAPPATPRTEEDEEVERHDMVNVAQS